MMLYLNKSEYFLDSCDYQNRVASKPVMRAAEVA
jgi:hypothetical protein